MAANTTSVRANAHAGALSDRYPAKQHAARVAEQLFAKAGLIYLAASPTRALEDSDQSDTFRQRRYFYYLTGVDEPDCAVTYDIARQQLVLWLAPFTPKQVVWTGRGSSIEEAYQKYDIDGADYTDALPKFINQWVQNASQHDKLFVLHPQHAHLPPGGHLHAARLDTKYLLPSIDRCRVIKDDHEIALITRANEISAMAHIAVLHQIRHFTSESQVAATFLAQSVANGAPNQAYNIIAGAGPNGAVLHYSANNGPIDTRLGHQSMVLDAGAEFNLYASDVTRSFPISGHWSKEGQEIYNLVEEVQAKAMAMVGPGKRILDAHVMVHKWILQGLKKLNIVVDADDNEMLAAGISAAFYPHGLGHQLGLEVHDVSAPKEDKDAAAWFLDMLEEDSVTARSMPYQAMKTIASMPMRNHEICTLRDGDLQPGMVVTVEPGVYFSRYALETLYKPNPELAKYINWDVLENYYPVGGVRIEDNLLITKDGWRNLTTAPKGDEALRIIRGEE